MNLLLDTHIWLWYLQGSEKLPAHFKKAVESKENIVWLSPISPWEAMVLAYKNKIVLYPNPSSWIRKALQTFPCKEAGLNFEISILARELDWEHQDPADRFLLATAHYYNLTMMTVDQLFKKQTSVRIF